MIKLGGYQDQGKERSNNKGFWFLRFKNKEFEKHAGKLAMVADGMGDSLKVKMYLMLSRNLLSLIVKKLLKILFLLHC